MPYDALGNFSLVSGYLAVTGQKVLPSNHNPPLEDIGSALSQVLLRSGAAPMTGDINMNGFRLIDLPNATLPGHAVAYRQFAGILPVGTILDYAGAAAPTGFMFCAGQSVKRVDFPELFAAIGTAFGAGDGSTTFLLPDARGRVTAAKDDMGGTDAQRLSFFAAAAKTIGGVFGVASHVLTLGQMPKHDHTGKVGAAGKHRHTIANMGLWTSDGSTSVRSWGQTGQTLNTDEAPDHDHTIPSQGADEAHTNAQPTLIINKIIRVFPV